MSLSFSSDRIPAASDTGRAPSGYIRDALRAAAAQAAERLATLSGTPVAPSRDDLMALVDRIYGAPNVAVPGDHVHRYTRREIGAFRAEFLARLAGDGTTRAHTDEMFRVLLALDEVANADERELAGGFGEWSAEALKGMVEIAHDMRSPLGAILLLVEPIRRGHNGPVTPVQERQLALIYGAALSLSTLSNDIIDAARGTRVRASRRRPFSISGTIESACAVVRPIAEEKQLDLQQNYPAVDGRVGDAPALHRVLLNLVTNALKYTERGSVSVGCTELDDSNVEFWVKDTGPGIPEGQLATLFHGFRATASGLQFSSTGLGLSICCTLLRAMGGTLRVESSPQDGSRFSFVLDLERA